MLNSLTEAQRQSISLLQKQSQADNCDYGATQDGLIRERIVVGVKDHKLRADLKRLRHVAMAMKNSVLNKLAFRLKWPRYLSHRCFLFSQTKS